MKQAWFITGSSRGLGCALVRAALDADHRVVATARRPGQLDDLLAEYGDRIHAIAVEGSIRLDERLLAEDRRWSNVSRSADLNEPYPVEFPADEPA